MAFTSTYSTILSSQTDANSPLDVTLIDGFRQNIDYLFEYIGGKTYTPSTSHDHDGVNSKPVISVASSAITVTHLKLSTGSVTGVLAFANNVTVAINRYAHIHQSYATNGGAGHNQMILALYPHTSSALQNGISIRNDHVADNSTYALTWDYHAT